MMTAKEYFKQAHRLDQRIDSRIDELSQLRQLVTSLSSPTLTGKVKTSQANEGTFARSIEKIIECEDRINKEIDMLVDFKDEMRGVIDAMSDANEAMVLRYRYVNSYDWDRICEELQTKRRTVLRWHGDALAHAVLPANPTRIL